MRIERPILKTFAAVVLAACAVAFAVLNLRDRLHRPPVPDDGVVWVSSDAGVMAQDVRPDSPGWNAGIRHGQVLLAIYHDGEPEAIRTPDDVRAYLDDAWSKPPGERSLVYVLEVFNSRNVSRGVWEGDVRNIEAKPVDMWRELYFALIGAVYLGIGLFVLLRQARAPYTTHFYWICLTSFLFYVLGPAYARSRRHVDAVRPRRLPD